MPGYVGQRGHDGTQLTTLAAIPSAPSGSCVFGTSSSRPAWWSVVCGCRCVLSGCCARQRIALTMWPGSRCHGAGACQRTQACLSDPSCWRMSCDSFYCLFFGGLHCLNLHSFFSFFLSFSLPSTCLTPAQLRPHREDEAVAVQDRHRPHGGCTSVQLHLLLQGVRPWLWWRLHHAHFPMVRCNGRAPLNPRCCRAARCWS